METLAQMMGVTHGVRISQDSIDGLAVRWTKANGSRADRTKIAGETRARGGVHDGGRGQHEQGQRAV